MGDLHLLATKPDSPALTETWLDGDIRECEVILPSYRLLRRDRDRHGGGVALCIHESITIRSVSCHPRYAVELITQTGILLLGVISGQDSDLCNLEDRFTHPDLARPF